MTARLSDQGAPDWILEELVRSNLGRIPSNTRAIDVRADGGYIYLNGPALRHERDEILKAAARTRGVYGVEDELQLFDNPRNIPSLQGTPSPRSQAAPDVLQQNWSPATRLLGGVGGSLLTLYGLRRSGISKPLLSTAGLIITAIAVNNTQI